ncbi:hypothetical protein EW026_g6870 [Hermanssonia centrifuga]|uniref:Major facilitator superfamily (MFS) profile domain-containing protein n=1 Tax=Hermanssonia centrifuga TaxID=98765 RepID=A0A4S4K9P0_9APHY|nr:hypothetical protein EW026_g6870 [Hermanssonia centrifuga]
MSHPNDLTTNETPLTDNNDNDHPHVNVPQRGERFGTMSSETATLDEPAVPKNKPTATTDLYFIPIPRYLRYNPDSPPHFGLYLNVLFGLASTFCLLLLSPLGDLVRRRPLILLLAFLAAALTIGLPLTSSIIVFEVLSFFIGAMSVVPQILMPFAADLAPPERRASALSIVLAGLLLGVLIARVLAGIIANFASWRIVYWLAFGLQTGILGLLYFMLPDFPAKNEHMTYGGILYSMAKFTVTEPLLIQSLLVNMASMACFTNFWVTLTFLLGGPPYNYSTLVIGLFGLVGMVGVAMAPVVGRIIDRVIPWLATVIATFGSLIFYSIQTGAGGINIAAVIIACFGIDVFRQTQQVSLTTAVFGLDANARSRLNAVLIISVRT